MSIPSLSRIISRMFGKGSLRTVPIVALMLQVLVLGGLMGYISFGSDRINSGNSLLLGLVALALALALGLAISHWISQPIRRLRRALRAIALGEDPESWQPLLEVERTDELGQLLKSFRETIAPLQTSLATLKAKNEELQQLDQLKDRFLASAVHELRTPLNGIIGLAEFSMEDDADPLSEQQRQNLLVISSSGHRLYHLTNDILDVVRLKYKEIELQIQPLDLHTIVEGVLQMNNPLLGQKDLQLINAIPAHFSLVKADENRLQQILYNLVGNAIKFTESGRVEVSAQLLADRPQHFIAITISDTGFGIPEERLAQVFEFFQQTGNSTAIDDGGIGLGLAIAKQLVELHGSQLQINSAVGGGSQLTFTLPTSNKSPKNNCLSPVFVPISETDIDKILVERRSIFPSQFPIPNPAQKTRDPGQHSDRIQILIVDDDPTNIQVILNYLGSDKYAIAHAYSGPKALELIENNPPPDLILLDVVMPGMSGYEVCKKIREQFHSHELPIVMLTAKNQLTEMSKSLDAGANDYLTKPISKHELIARIKTHLRLSNLNAAYSRFVPNQFLEILQKDSILEVKLGDNILREMSVLFSDIRSFTSLSEKMTPEENFRFINSYLSRMEPSIMKNNGFIDKYIGDSIMALFSGGADDAIKAAIDMLHALVEYNQHRQNIGYDPVKIGIGINTGSLMLGTVGGKNRMDGTVISDAVNLASRIESLTKQYGISLLISHQTFAKLENPNDYMIRLIERLKVKGKSESVAVFEVFDGDLPEQRNAKRATTGIFEQGILFYYGSSFRKAAERFEECLRYNPEDRVAQIYLERCKKYLVPLRGS